tara:strand:+ start:160 stop:330 length:171 start_codon:yes stop_codon:yes gene_type:complete
MCKNLNESDLQKKIFEGYRNFNELAKVLGIGEECKACLTHVKLIHESMKENLNENR